jgi:hypothetical protein
VLAFARRGIAVRLNRLDCFDPLSRLRCLDNDSLSVGRLSRIDVLGVTRSGAGASAVFAIRLGDRPGQSGETRVKMARYTPVDALTP